MTELERIALAMGLLPDELTSSRRTTELMISRRIAIWYLHEVKGYSYTDIARLLNKERSTIVFHRHRHHDALRTWRAYSEAFRKFMKTMVNNI